MKTILTLGINFIFLLSGFCQSAKSKPGVTKNFSGNPVFAGWYADPEVRVFNKQYWIYPTYSAPYEEQVFLDAFSSTDLVNWKKHSHIVDTANFKWANKAVWAPS